MAVSNVERDYWERSQQEAVYRDKVLGHLDSIRRGVWALVGFLFVGVLVGWLIFWSGVL